jgi:hypothetical protein
MRVKIEMIVDVSDICNFDNEQESDWFADEIMQQKDLRLHSNEIGDELGDIEDLKWSYINDNKLI